MKKPKLQFILQGIYRDHETNASESPGARSSAAGIGIRFEMFSLRTTKKLTILSNGT